MSMARSLATTTIAAVALVASLGLASAQSGGGGSGSSGGSSSGSAGGTSAGGSRGMSPSAGGGAATGSPSYSIGPDAQTGLAPGGGVAGRGAGASGAGNQFERRDDIEFEEKTVRCADGSISKLGEKGCLGGR